MRTKRCSSACSVAATAPEPHSPGDEVAAEIEIAGGDRRRRSQARSLVRSQACRDGMCVAPPLSRASRSRTR
eukprot:scaffold49115_cov62-Phaeocystis_antarctica.AAC.4